VFACRQQPAGLPQFLDDFFRCVSLSFHECWAGSRAADSHNSWLNFRGALHYFLNKKR
jgi:hypothetical protein